eukprot:TRINITY_DN29457_c0_g1_i1.p1 TRINITY_DN29457_c0_g1~~TRINITY_DN29457_c0_g1_i1.p1  ORF type:complete len:953 (+),score=167.82 TRINITY_DN29457_c0_g1_i1:311-2860(+)
MEGCVRMPSRTNVCVADESNQAWEKIFSFDRAYWSTDESQEFASQQTLQDELGTELMEIVLDGYNACMFAYGQTGSGKTFSVLGSQAPPEQRGLLPRIVDALFDRVEELKSDGTSFTFNVTYMEIYQEQCRDLLRPRDSLKEAPKLTVHQSPTVGIYVQGLSNNPAFKAEDVRHLLDFGTKSRTVGATSMNDQSSRSHCIFTLETKQVKKLPGGGTSTMRCKLNLVDLAGSERQSKTHATGTRLKEGCNINQSLSNLSLVIHKLAEMSEKSDSKRGSKVGKDFVPFRNSKLTYVLQDSLSGNSKTLMMAAISPAKDNAEETISTLRFAESVKTIRTKATKNEESEVDLVSQLKAECDRLKAMMGQGGSCHEELLGMQALAERYGMNVESQLEVAQQQEDARAAALADMGLTVREVSECLGMEATTPVLANVSADASLDATLVYFLRTGQTSIGESEDNTIMTKGIGMATTSAYIINKDNISITLRSVAGRVLLNGFQVTHDTIFRHGDRLDLGYSWSFALLVPGATQDQEHHEWEMRCLHMTLGEFFQEGSEAHQQLHLYLNHLSDKVGTTRALMMLLELRRANALVEEAQAITNELRPNERWEFVIEALGTIFSSEAGQPTPIVRLQKGETGAVRWRNVTRRKIIMKEGSLHSNISRLIMSGLGGAPPPWNTIFIVPLPVFRGRVIQMRVIHEAYKRGDYEASQKAIEQSDPWSDVCTSKSKQDARIAELELENAMLRASCGRATPLQAMKSRNSSCGGLLGFPGISSTPISEESGAAASLAGQLLESLQGMKRDLKSHGTHVEELRKQKGPRPGRSSLAARNGSNDRDRTRRATVAVGAPAASSGRV